MTWYALEKSLYIEYCTVILREHTKLLSIEYILRVPSLSPDTRYCVLKTLKIFYTRKY